MALFLVAGLIALGVLAARGEASRRVGFGVLGGPSGNPYLNEVDAVVSGRPILLAEATNQSFSGREIELRGLYDAAIADPGQPVGPAMHRGELFIYKVQKGDTLSQIAASFGVTVQTLIDANPKVRASSLRINDELMVLPVSGVVYRTEDGESLEAIASLFSVREDRIRQANPSVNFSALGPGIPLVIPGVQRADRAYALGNSLADLGSYFILPAEGFNWARLHTHNAVDIANTCGTPVRAAAEGLVVPDESFGDGIAGWNGGYGHFVLIEHPFGDGVRTRYAIFDVVCVEIGNYAQQAQQIGTVGDTGEATGCHLHFEVYGAKNPFVK